jgi:hypothetical protein
MNLEAELREGGGEFKAFAEHAQQDPRCKGMPLSSLLITPVKRVPR